MTERTNNRTNKGTNERTNERRCGPMGERGWEMGGGTKKGLAFHSPTIPSELFRRSGETQRSHDGNQLRWNSH